MSWELTGLVSRKKWGGQTKRLLALTMADKANDDGSGVYASVKTLARDSEISEATARRAIKEFIDAGVIVKTGERECLNGHTNIYCLQASVIEAMADLKPPQKASVKGAASRQGSQADRGLSKTPDAQRAQTPVTVTDKPILEPKSSSSNEEEDKRSPKDLFGKQAPEKATADQKRKGRKVAAYTPEFQMIWMAWPKNRRANSDKRKAFERYQGGVEQFGAEAISAAARRYLSLPDTRKDQWKYCCLVEVFMNGKLEAAVEAAREEATPAEAVTHEEAKHGAARAYHKKTGRWPPNYRPPEVRQ